MAWKPILPHCFWILCAGLLLAGCQEQEPIRSYDVPKEPPKRLLTVMVPGDDTTWFIKLMGPAPEVAKHVQTFDAFVATVHFSPKGEPPIEWTVPENWTEEHSDKRFEAVIRFAGKGMPLPITISRLGGPQAKDLLANVNRWRTKQLGLDKITENDLKKLEQNQELKKLQVDGRAATRVDFVGTGVSKGLQKLETAAPTRPFKFTKPKDWEELPADAVQGFRRDAVFQVRQGDHTAQTTVMRLGGDGGGGLRNVNRWRRELGLEATSEEQLARDRHSLDTPSGKAEYVELTGRVGNTARSTLGAWLTAGGQTWFITMKGPTDLVHSQKSEFEAFVQSFRVESGAGVAHE